MFIAGDLLVRAWGVNPVFESGTLRNLSGWRAPTADADCALLRGRQERRHPGRLGFRFVARFSERSRAPGIREPRGAERPEPRSILQRGGAARCCRTTSPYCGRSEFQLATDRFFESESRTRATAFSIVLAFATAFCRIVSRRATRRSSRFRTTSTRPCTTGVAGRTARRCRGRRDGSSRMPRRQIDALFKSRVGQPVRL